MQKLKTIENLISLDEEIPAQNFQKNLLGNRIPRDYFITKGQGESDITVHAGSYHLALRQAGIEMCNIMTYSSIMPVIAREVRKPKILTHGSVMETITAVSTATKGKRATASIIFGWLYDKKTGDRHGGLVCEYNGEDEPEVAEAQLKESINELYTNGYDGKYELRDFKYITQSFIPKKKFGTALAAICFVNYLFPTT